MSIHFPAIIVIVQFLKYHPFYIYCFDDDNDDHQSVILIGKVFVAFIVWLLF